MKPLELHIYDKHPDTDAYRVGGAYQPYCLVSADKRFRPGELGAEVWRAVADILDPSNPVGLAVRRQRIMERFATLPHYDEADQ